MKLDNLTLYSVFVFEHGWWGEQNKDIYDSFMATAQYKVMNENPELKRRMLVYLKLYYDMVQIQQAYISPYAGKVVRRFIFDGLSLLRVPNPRLRLTRQYSALFADANKAYKDYEMLRKLYSDEALAYFILEPPSVSITQVRQ